MIEKIVAHVVGELGTYVELRTQIANRVAAESLFKLDGQVNTEASEKILVQVVNVAEERTYRSTKTLERRDDGTHERVQPPVKVNLFLHCVANMTSYLEALKALGQVLGFFQRHPAIAFAAVPGLEDLPGRLTFELQSPTFEQVNHLWGALGSKYQPSALYKVGILDVRDRLVDAEVPPVLELTIQT